MKAAFTAKNFIYTLGKLRLSKLAGRAAGGESKRGELSSGI